MRTKTILLSAACGLVAAAAANADSVYSVNVVGYVNLNLEAGKFKMICSPLNGTNTISTVFSSLTDADITTYVFIWDNASNGYKYAVYGGTDPVDGGWYDDNGDPANNLPLAVGQGFWIKSIRSTTVTFVGDVMTGSLSQPIKAGWNQIGSQVPQNAGIDALGLTGAGAGDTIFQWLGNGWGIFSWDPDAQAWYDVNNDVNAAPQLGLGEAVWYKNYNATYNWTRTFNVN